jgi:hypothetical protein
MLSIEYLGPNTDFAPHRPGMTHDNPATEYSSYLKNMKKEVAEHLSLATKGWQENATVPEGVDVEIGKEVEGRGRGLFATRVFQPGEKIFEFYGQTYDIDFLDPRYLEHALQVGLREFLVSTEFHFDNFLNHSSNPNCWIHFEKNEHGETEIWLEALRKIHPHEELTFNYNTTEWDMEDEGGGQSSAFNDLSAADERLQRVAGYVHVPEELRPDLEQYLSPAIINLRNIEERRKERKRLHRQS